jgi:hypothetical protein
MKYRFCRRKGVIGKQSYSKAYGKKSICDHLEINPELCSKDLLSEIDKFRFKSRLQRANLIFTGLSLDEFLLFHVSIASIASIEEFLVSSFFSHPLKNFWALLFSHVDLDCFVSKRCRAPAKILVGKDVSDVKASVVSKGVAKANLKALIGQVDDADSGENETNRLKKEFLFCFDLSFLLSELFDDATFEKNHATSEN